MNKKLAREISQPYTLIGLIGMLVLSAVLFWLNIYIGLGAIALSFLVYGFHLYFTRNYAERAIDRYEKSVLKEREDYMDAFTYGSPLLLCVVNMNAQLIWSNPNFDEVFNSPETLKESLTPERVMPFFESNDAVQIFKAADKDYLVTCTDVNLGARERRMLFWQDITQRETLKIQLRDTRACAAYISIDNYSEILEATPVEEQSTVAADIDKAMHGWALSMDALMARTRSDKYLMIFEHKYLRQLREKRFPILNKMHEIETKAEFPTSISIGVSTGEPDLAGLQDGAQAALDLALGRGGDQAVVRNRAGETEYYGGTLPTVEKRNKGKSRVMAHIFAQLVESAENVVIMGHTRPDMDCFGAAIGMYALVKNIGKPVDIVLENPGDAISLIYNEAERVGGFDFVDHETAKAEMTDGTLLVVVDHHRAVISECPELVSMAKKIAVIDHHRRSSDAIENAQLSYMEVYASSASELVAEILQYSGSRGEIGKFEAEALLAGIELDTKNFTVNAGVRTFDAASWLRRCGADNANVKSFFKMSLDFYKRKSAIIASAEIMPGGIAVAYTRDTDPAMQVLVSQVADDLLEMRGVEAAFVSGVKDTRTMLSARSNGKINVQTLMEKLGGGGHQTVAAAQLSMGPEESIAAVIKTLREEGIIHESNIA